MLNTSFFVEIQRILSVGGTVTVLTDNEWYGSFLANQLDGFLDSDHCLLESVELECGAGDETPEVSSVADFPESDREIRSRKVSNVVLSSLVCYAPVTISHVYVQVADQVGGVTLYEGEPGSNCGYQQSISGQSYFDRLWSRGVSRHADQSRRWFVCLRRLSEHKVCQSMLHRANVVSILNSNAVVCACVAGSCAREYACRVANCTQC